MRVTSSRAPLGRTAAAATAAAVRASATLFRLGFLADLATAMFWLLTAMALYGLLHHVHRAAAAAMVTFAAVGAAIMVFDQVCQFVALTIATGADNAHTFGGAGSDRLTLIFVDLQRAGSASDNVFFGLWLLPLGYLVIRSGYFPRILGVLQVIACVGYVAATYVIFLAPALGSGYVSYVMVPAATAGELTFIVWLIVKGVRQPTPAWTAPAQ